MNWAFGPLRLENEARRWGDADDATFVLGVATFKRHGPAVAEDAHRRLVRQAGDSCGAVGSDYPSTQPSTWWLLTSICDKSLPSGIHVRGFPICQTSRGAAGRQSGGEFPY